jgi:hypothetical protein
LRGLTLALALFLARQIPCLAGPTSAAAVRAMTTGPSSGVGMTLLLFRCFFWLPLASLVRCFRRCYAWQASFSSIVGLFYGITNTATTRNWTGLAGEVQAVETKAIESGVLSGQEIVRYSAYSRLVSIIGLSPSSHDEGVRDWDGDLPLPISPGLCPHKGG